MANRRDGGSPSRKRFDRSWVDERVPPSVDKSVFGFGSAGFGAVDAFEADSCFPAVSEDLNSVPVRYPNTRAGEGFCGECSWS